MNSTRLKISALLIITQIINASDAPTRSAGTPPLSPRSAAALFAALGAAPASSMAAITSASAPLLSSAAAPTAAPAGIASAPPTPQRWVLKDSRYYMEFSDGRLMPAIILYSSNIECPNCESHK